MALSKRGIGRNERGTVQQAHLLKTTRIYSQSNEFMHVCTVKAMKSCTYAGKKAIQPTISKGVCTDQHNPTTNKTPTQPNTNQPTNPNTNTNTTATQHNPTTNKTAKGATRPNHDTVQGHGLKICGHGPNLCGHQHRRRESWLLEPVV